MSLQARQYLTEDIYASVNIVKLSDTRFLQDFYESEFLRNPHPDNALSITKFADDWTATLIGRKQLNQFFDGTERTPALAFDITRQPFLRSRAFYEGQTSGGVYRRNFATGSALPDFGYSRVDSFHQFMLPHTFGGWLNVVPRLGFRGTWYSQTGSTVRTAPITPYELRGPHGKMRTERSIASWKQGRSSVPFSTLEWKARSRHLALSSRCKAGRGDSTGCAISFSPT